MGSNTTAKGTCKEGRGWRRTPWCKEHVAELDIARSYGVGLVSSVAAKNRTELCSVAVDISLLARADSGDRVRRTHRRSTQLLPVEVIKPWMAAAPRLGSVGPRPDNRPKGRRQRGEVEPGAEDSRTMETSRRVGPDEAT